MGTIILSLRLFQFLTHSLSFSHLCIFLFSPLHIPYPNRHISFYHNSFFTKPRGNSCRSNLLFHSVLYNMRVDLYDSTKQTIYKYEQNKRYRSLTCEIAVPLLSVA